MPGYAIILLAAGASSRMGSPKQLLIYKGKTFLQHSIDAALDSGAEALYLVLGAHADNLKTTVPPQIRWIYNDAWEEGMGSSIRCGMKAVLRDFPDTEAVIIMVCDQPFIDPEVLKSIMQLRKSTGKSIIVSNYGNAIGPPVLFQKSLFAELSAWKGDIGARKILQKHPDDIAEISFPRGALDIDTAAEYEALQKESGP